MALFPKFRKSKPQSPLSEEAFEGGNAYFNRSVPRSRTSGPRVDDLLAGAAALSQPEEDEEDMGPTLDLHAEVEEDPALDSEAVYEGDEDRQDARTLHRALSKEFEETGVTIDGVAEDVDDTEPGDEAEAPVDVSETPAPTVDAEEDDPQADEAVPDEPVAALTERATETAPQEDSKPPRAEKRRWRLPLGRTDKADKAEKAALDDEEPTPKAKVDRVVKARTKSDKRARKTLQELARPSQGADVDTQSAVEQEAATGPDIKQDGGAAERASAQDDLRQLLKKAAVAAGDHEKPGAAAQADAETGIDVAGQSGVEASHAVETPRAEQQPEAARPDQGAPQVQTQTQTQGQTQTGVQHQARPAPETDAAPSQVSALKAQAQKVRERGAAPRDARSSDPRSPAKQAAGARTPQASAEKGPAPAAPDAKTPSEPTGDAPNPDASSRAPSAPSSPPSSPPSGTRGILRPRKARASQNAEQASGETSGLAQRARESLKAKLATGATTGSGSSEPGQQHVPPKVQATGEKTPGPTPAEPVQPKADDPARQEAPHPAGGALAVSAAPEGGALSTDVRKTSRARLDMEAMKNAPDLGAMVRKEVIAGGIIVGVFALFLAGWSALAPLSSAAIAPGVVSPQGSRKTVQHLEGGIIDRILVEEGSQVEAGEPIVLLKDTMARSSYDLIRNQYYTLGARLARLTALQNGQLEVVFPDWLMAEASDPVVEGILASERNLLRTSYASHNDKKAVLQEQIGQLEKEIDGLKAQVVGQDKQLALIANEIEGVQELFDKGLARKSRLLALQRDEAEIRARKGANVAQIAKTEQAISETELQLIASDAVMQDDVAKEIAEVQGKFSEAGERMAASSDILNRIEIRAPVSGRVIDLKYHTAGGIIAPGSPIMDIVPKNEDLLIEARVSPLDIDVVYEGLEAQIRLSAFAQRNLPMIKGRVRSVSADRKVDQVTGQPYFQATVEILPNEVAKIGENVTLTSGMPAEVMIVTGEQTLMGYLFGPVMTTFRHAFREG